MNAGGGDYISHKDLVLYLEYMGDNRSVDENW